MFLLRPGFIEQNKLEMKLFTSGFMLMIVCYLGVCEWRQPGRPNSQPATVLRTQQRRRWGMGAQSSYVGK